MDQTRTPDDRRPSGVWSTLSEEATSTKNATSRGGNDDDEQDAPPSGEAGSSAPKRSTKKATTATSGSSTKKVGKAAAPKEPPKDNAEGERYTHADCVLLIRLVNDADAEVARILNRTEKIDKVWTFVREGFNE
eukprot:jgi/Tetstr1/436882/TSEL_025658.t1